MRGTQEVEPFTRRRHPKPFTLQRLDTAILSEGNSEEKLLLTFAALRALETENRPPTMSELRRIKILARRYPDLPWERFLGTTRPDVVIKLRELSLSRLVHTSFSVEPIQQPLLGKFFEREAKPLIELTQALTGSHPDTIAPYFPTRSGSFAPYQSIPHYQREALTTNTLLRCYRDDLWRYKLEEGTTLPVAFVLDARSSEELLSVTLLPAEELNPYLVNRICANTSDISGLFSGASLRLEWEGKPKTPKHVVELVKETCY